jgi:ATP-dependent helicase/nuclease subunit B
LVSIDLSGRLDALAKDLDANGDNRNAQILNQLWEILITALEQLHDVLSQASWDTETFTRLFKLLLTQYDVGTIPTVLDSVTVGPVNAMRCQQSKHLIVLGVLEGSMPGYGCSSGVLTDQERTVLREMGVPLNGGAMNGLQATFHEIYGAFCGAEESIFVSCPSGQPSFIYRRLSELAGGETQVLNDLGTSFADETEAGAYLVRWGAESKARELGIEDAFQNMLNRSKHKLGSVEPDNIRQLYGSKLMLSASQVDRQAECRLSYFLKYGLRAKERKKAEVDPAEFGTYVHAVLENTAREIKARGGFRAVSLEETLQIAKSFSDTYANERFVQLDSERISYLFQRNSAELELIVQELWGELHDSGFEAVDFEVAFGKNAQMPAINIPSSTIDAQLRGFVDRVDKWCDGEQNYFRVVDYKTGRKDFDYCDIFNGLGLQMLLYLFTLEQEGEELLGESPIPAGVQYFPARVPLVAADGLLSDEDAAAAREKVWKRKGLLLSDLSVLDAMESEITPRRMPYSRKKDGSISGDIADADQLQTLKRYVFKLLGRMVDEIASGCVNPNPYTRGASHDACTFCPYGQICHRENVQERRNYKAISAQKFWDDIAKEVADNG